MAFIRAFASGLTTVRKFFGPHYQPERHYMRGPGPACARRHVQG